MAYIKGNFRKYIFRSDKNYVVGLFKIKDTDLDYKGSSITFTGYFGDLNESDIYLFNGDLVSHDKYGDQFSVSSYEVVLPDDRDHVIDFLSSELFKGIGVKKAKSIVDTLGVNCLSLILDNKDVLREVSGVTSKQVDVIYDSLLLYKSSYDKMVNLVGLGFSMRDALKIEKFYSNNLDLVFSSPYQMIDDIPDITFSKIDKLRGNFDIALDDLSRVSYGIVYVLLNLSFRTGDTYFSYDVLVNYSKRVLGVSDDVINKGISNLVNLGKIIIDGDRYVLLDVYNKEVYVSKRVSALTRDFLSLSYSDEISSLEEELGIVFNREQRDATIRALNFDFSIITGGPGTGKTKVIKAIVGLYKKINGFSRKELLDNLVLLAPTGRASKRMSMESGIPSYTIHRFLKWQKEENTFLINEDNKSDARFVIIDEASMLDTDLFYNLLLGLKASCKIVMIGDYNQLPSVGAGQVLKDLIESDVVPVTFLKTLYRQNSNSNINFFAHDIISGKLDMSLFNESDDLTFVNASGDSLRNCLSDFVITYKDMSIYDFQVLVPMYKGDNGIDALNMYLQDILNEKSNSKNEFLYNGTFYREGDKVIQLVNSVEDNVFNGDIGEIVRVNSIKKKEVVCDFDGNIVNYGVSSFENFKLGYVISIHKSQGSEFNVVVIPVLNSYSFMLYRKLIYTAVTRAKSKLIIIGEESALRKAISIDRDENRKTFLKELLVSSI